MITNKWILGNADYSDALKLRHEVFAEERGMAAGPDEMDPLAMHLVLYDGVQPVAAGRVYHDGRAFRIGMCCVEKSRRGGGFGDLLIKLLILKAFEFSHGEVRLSACADVAVFFKRYGFFATGDEFLEDGIRRVPMSITRDSMVFPSKCGKDKHFSDFFERRPEPV